MDNYRGAESILVADDEPIVLSLAQVVLRNHGYEVLTAKDGLEALDVHHRTGRVDLLLTDVVMPTMTGPELVHEIKKEAANLRCIFMSGYDRDQVQSMA